MADNNKTITIGAKADPSLKTVLSSVEKEVAKANKTLGAGTAANPGMLKHLKQMAEAFMGIKKSGTDAFKTLATEAERAANKEQASLGRIKKYISELTGAYSSLSAAQKAASGVQTQGRGANFQPQITRWSAGQGAYGVPPLARPPGGPPGGVPPPPGPTGKQPPGMSPADIALMSGTIARAIGGVLQQAGGFGQSIKNMDVQSVGSMQQMTTNRFLQGALSGDLSDSYILNRKRSMLRGGGTVGQRLEEHAGGKIAPGAELLGQGISGLGTAAASIGGMMIPGGAAARGAMSGAVRTARGMSGSAQDLSSGLLQTATAGAKYAYGGLDLAEMQNEMGNIDAYRAANPMLMAAQQMINEEKHMRASQSRRLMGKELSAYGLGGGYGYSRGEAGGVAEGLQRLGGMQGMFGASKMVSAAAQVSPDLGVLNMGGIPSIGGFGRSAMMGSNSYGGTPTGLTPQSGPQMKRITTSRGLLESAMQLAGHGIDMSVGQGALSNIFQATGGKSSEGSMQAIERAIARGTTAGFTDPRAQEELVGALGQAAQGRIMDGTDALDRLANFMMGGGKGNGTVAEAQANNRAMAGLNSMSKNPYVNGKQLAFAKTISNDQIQQEYLGRATVEQLASGPDARMQAVGVTKEMMKKTLQYTMQNLMSSVSGASPKLQAALKKGGPIDEKLLMAEGFGRMGAFDNDQDALSAARKYNASFEDLDIKTKGERVKQYTSGAAIAAISTEERTKQLLEKFVSDLTKYMANQEGLMGALTDAKIAEDQNKNYDIQRGKVFMVQILKDAGTLNPTPVKK